MAKLLMKDAETVHAAEPDYLSPALRTMLFNIVNSQVKFPSSGSDNPRSN